jgi:hypothetical protein
MQVFHPIQGPFFEQGSLLHTNTSQAIVHYHQLPAFQNKLYLKNKKKGKGNITKAQLITIISLQTIYLYDLSQEYTNLTKNLGADSKFEGPEG